MRLAGRGGNGNRRHGKSIVAAWLCLLCVANAHAENWTLENTLSTRYEANNNASLLPVSPGTMNTYELSTVLNAARRAENSATELSANLGMLQQHGPGAQDRLDGTLGFTQSLSGPLDDFNLSGRYLQDFNDQPATADVTVGRGRRRLATLSAQLSHSLTERFKLSAQADTETAAYEQIGGVDYRNNSVSTGVSYRLAEATSLALNLSRSDYRTRDGRNRSTTDQYTVTLSSAPSERSSWSLGLGRYDTDTRGTFTVVFCPVDPSSLCPNPVGFAREDLSTTTQGSGLQYNVSASHRFSEKTGLSMRAAREQSPSGSGTVVRNDNARIGLDHAFSERTRGNLDFTQQRSVYQNVEVRQRPSQETVSLSLTRELTPDLSLQAGLRHVESQGAYSFGGARSDSVNLSLNFRWPRFEASH